MRERTHWNSANIKPTDPVSLGLCTQIDLDEQVKRASSRRRKLEEENPEMLNDTLKAQDELDPGSDEFNPDDVDLETLFGGSKQD